MPLAKSLKALILALKDSVEAVSVPVMEEFQDPRIVVVELRPRRESLCFHLFLSHP